MAVTVTDLRDYLRLPPDSAEDLSRYLEAARSKARTAGIPEFQNNAQYDLLILNLASLYYDHRGLTFGGTYQHTAEPNARKLLNAFVLELRYATEDPEPEGGEDP